MSSSDGVLFARASNLANSGIDLAAFAEPMVAALHAQLFEPGGSAAAAHAVHRMPWEKLKTLEMEARAGVFVEKPQRAGAGGGRFQQQQQQQPAVPSAPRRWNQVSAARPQPTLLAQKAFLPQMWLPSKGMFLAAERLVRGEMAARREAVRAALGAAGAGGASDQQEPLLGFLFQEKSTLTSDIRVQEPVPEQAHNASDNFGRRPPPPPPQETTRVTIDLRTLQPDTCIDKMRMITLDFGVTAAPLDVRIAISSETATSNNQGNNNAADSAASSNRVEAIKALAMEQFLMMELPEHCEPEIVEVEAGGGGVDDGAVGDGDDEVWGDGDEEAEEEEPLLFPVVNLAPPAPLKTAAKPAVAVAAPAVNNNNVTVGGTVTERRKSRKSFYFDGGIVVDLTHVMSDGGMGTSGGAVTLEMELEWDVQRAIECARRKAEAGLLPPQEVAEIVDAFVNLVPAIDGQQEQQAELVAEQQHQRERQLQLRKNFLSQGTTMLAQAMLALALALKSSQQQGGAVRARQD